jgi:hypothetical protein
VPTKTPASATGLLWDEDYHHTDQQCTPCTNKNDPFCKNFQTDQPCAVHDDNKEIRDFLDKCDANKVSRICVPYLHGVGDKKGGGINVLSRRRFLQLCAMISIKKKKRIAPFADLEVLVYQSAGDTSKDIHADT